MPKVNIPDEIHTKVAKEAAKAKMTVEEYLVKALSPSWSKEKGDAKRTAIVRTRLTDEEHEELTCSARIAGMTKAEYIRKRIFGIRIAAKADLGQIAVLRSLVGLVKDHVAACKAKDGCTQDCNSFYKDIHHKLLEQLNGHQEDQEPKD